MKRRGESEAAQQMRGLQHLAALGWRCWRIGQRSAKGTQDPGVPDVYALHPAHGALWWEAKREHGGVSSFYQKHFAKCCAEAGVAHVIGNFAALVEYLRRYEQEAA